MKWDEFKVKAKAKYVETKTKVHMWYVQNETEIWTKGMIVLPVAATIVGHVCKAAKLNAEEHHRLMEKWDPATGIYCQLKRPLKPADIERMMTLQRQFGITQTEALIRLNLVK